MSTVVISEQGGRLSRRGGQMIMTKESKKIFIQPMVNLKHLILMGRVEISAGLMSYLLQKGIDVAFLSIDGKYKGRLASPVSKNVFIRRLQYDKLDDEVFRLRFSGAVVRAKAQNYGRMIQKRAPVVYDSFKQRLENMIRSIAVAGETDVLRGLEGSFSALYFRHLPAMLVETYGFKKRIKHPPPDPVNILLSLCYTLLFNNVYAFVEAAGLDPYCGYLHELQYGHPALVSDLMEEFRAPVADSLVITMINRKQIRPEHFQQENDKIKITKEGLGIIFEQYRKAVENKLTYKNLKLNYLQIIERQVWQFMQMLKGETDEYEGFRSP